MANSWLIVNIILADAPARPHRSGLLRPPLGTKMVRLGFVRRQLVARRRQVHDRQVRRRVLRLVLARLQPTAGPDDREQAFRLAWEVVGAVLEEEAGRASRELDEDTSGG